METDPAPATIMIVDDLPVNLRLLAAILQESHLEVVSMSRGEEALASLETSLPDLILLDVSMPGLDGFQVCERLKADRRWRDIPVLFISAHTETDAKVKGFAVGGVDYITKPFQIEEVTARVQTHLQLSKFRKALRHQNRQLEDLVREKVKEVADSQFATIFALAKLTERRDNDTGRHLERVQQYCQLLASVLSEHPSFRSEIDDEFLINLHHTTPLHDIGKVAIPDTILLKPGRLTAEEFEVMKTHTRLGAETLESVRSKYASNGMLSMAIEITRSHHEWWDGRGYPDGRKGNETPLAARIMSIVDVYDALRSKRVYKDALSHGEACDLIHKGAGTQFDPVIVEAFLALGDQFAARHAELVD